MRPKIRQILEECIEKGIEYGYLMAHKHHPDPPDNHIFSKIENAIWLEIDERFDFERNVCDEVVEGLGEIEEMRRKCIVKDCQNHAHQGGFTGDLCNPCYAFITDGTGVYSQAYRNSKREWVGLTKDEIADICESHYKYSEKVDLMVLNVFAHARELEAKLKELNA